MKLLDAKIADIDALLLLKNVKFNNFVNADRLVGFNTEETMAVMKVCDIQMCF